MSKNNLDVNYLYDSIKSLQYYTTIEDVKIAVNTLLGYIDAHTDQDVTISCTKYSNRIAVIKYLRHHLNIGLAEAKVMTEKPDFSIITTSDIRLALNIYNDIKHYGDVQVKGGNRATKVLFGI